MTKRIEEKLNPEQSSKLQNTGLIPHHGLATIAAATRWRRRW
jgi:hypothetical protein